MGSSCTHQHSLSQSTLGRQGKKITATIVINDLHVSKRLSVLSLYTNNTSLIISRFPLRYCQKWNTLFPLKQNDSKPFFLTVCYHAWGTLVPLVPSFIFGACATNSLVFSCCMYGRWLCWVLTACAGYMLQNTENIQSILIRMWSERLKFNSRKGWERKKNNPKKTIKRKGEVHRSLLHQRLYFHLVDTLPGFLVQECSFQGATVRVRRVILIGRGRIRRWTLCQHATAAVVLLMSSWRCDPAPLWVASRLPGSQTQE